LPPLVFRRVVRHATGMWAGSVFRGSEDVGARGRHLAR
jgi:hypothetical protein